MYCPSGLCILHWSLPFYGEFPPCRRLYPGWEGQPRYWWSSVPSGWLSHSMCSRHLLPPRMLRPATCLSASALFLCCHFWHILGHQLNYQCNFRHWTFGLHGSCWSGLRQRVRPCFCWSRFSGILSYPWFYRVNSSPPGHLHTSTTPDLVVSISILCIISIRLSPFCSCNSVLTSVPLAS